MYFNYINYFDQDETVGWSESPCLPTRQHGFDSRRGQKLIYILIVDPGGPVVVILATGSEVRGFKHGRGRWCFSESKNPEYDFLRKGSKAVGLVS